MPGNCSEIMVPKPSGWGAVQRAINPNCYILRVDWSCWVFRNKSCVKYTLTQKSATIISHNNSIKSLLIVSPSRLLTQCHGDYYFLGKYLSKSEALRTITFTAQAKSSLPLSKVVYTRMGRGKLCHLLNSFSVLVLPFSFYIQSLFLFIVFPLKRLFYGVINTNNMYLPADVGLLVLVKEVDIYRKWIDL